MNPFRRLWGWLFGANRQKTADSDCESNNSEYVFSPVCLPQTASRVPQGDKAETQATPPNREPETVEPALLWPPEALESPAGRVLRQVHHAPRTNPADAALLTLLGKTIRTGDLDLPRLPSLATELLSLNDDDMEDANGIAELVGRDPEVAGTVMKLANSALYASGHVGGLPAAITRLGTVLVREVAIGSAIHGVVYRVPGYDSEARIFRDRAFRTGLACSRAGMALGYGGNGGACFLSGLFHDVGNIIVLRALSRLRTQTRGQTANYRPSKALLHHLHVPLGVLYAADRKLPMAVRGAVANHHAPGTDPHHAATSWLVWAVNRLDKSLRGPDDPAAFQALRDKWPAEAPPVSAVMRHVRKARSMSTAIAA